MAAVVEPLENEEQGRGEYRAPAAEKALDILEFMADQANGLTQTEISAGLGRSLHEIYRILHLLERRGYLVRTKADRYQLSLKLFELAHMHPPVNRLVESALPVMRQLAADTDQSCHLVVLNGLQVLVVLQIESPLPMRYSVALGSQFPILETSSGAVLLAASEPADRDRIVGQILAAGEATDTRAAIEARLDEVRSLGHEVHASLAVAGCTNLSLPVFDHTGRAVAALTVPFLPQKAARFDQATVFSRAQRAAERISAALGAGEPSTSG
jgi:DNA-binding IclR family transcriptional regulator